MASGVGESNAVFCEFTGYEEELEVEKSGKVLLFSAGMDSTIAYYLLDRPLCLHVTGHSRYSKSELKYVVDFEERHPEMDLHINYQKWLIKYEEFDSNIPARNLLFSTIASYYGDTIYLIAQKGEQSIPDRNLEFFSDLSEMLTKLHKKPKLVHPGFPNDTKQDMVRKYLDAGHPKEELWKTYSCESAEPRRCGNCKMCARTAFALDYNNILPDNFFKNDIWKSSAIQEYIKHLDTYEATRAQQTREVLVKRGLL